MPANFKRWCARSARWWLRRNPTYLLSAAAMALGTRLYLVSREASAGDIWLILKTLGLLQLYELVLFGVLAVLHRARRSPEDQPSLLLIAALFWTGPMAATLELSAHHADLGLAFAGAAGLVALGELHLVRRVIELSFSVWSQLVAVGCLVLLTVAPLSLHVAPGEPGTDELALYFWWWLLGAIVLLVLPLPGYLRRLVGEQPAGGPARRLVEPVFLLVVVAATAVHLWAMNYAFFGNARVFYAGPALGAVAMVIFELLASWKIQSRALWAIAIVLPCVGFATACAGFHEKVPVRDLPECMRDPLTVAMALAAIAWWYGAWRGRLAVLLHMGTLAAGAAALRYAISPAGWNVAFDRMQFLTPQMHELALRAAYSTTVYLLAIAWLRRCRAEVVLALPMHLAALTLLVWNRYPADVFVIWIAAGWSMLLAVHLVHQRPTWFVALWPCTLLAIVSVYFAQDDKLVTVAAAHAAGMIAVFAGLGWLSVFRFYRAFAASFAGSLLVLGTGRAASIGRHPQAAAAVLCAFLLLGLGAMVSWNKHRLLRLADGQDDVDGAVPGE